jgi:ribosomal protein L32
MATEQPRRAYRHCPSVCFPGRGETGLNQENRVLQTAGDFFIPQPRSCWVMRKGASFRGALLALIAVTSRHEKRAPRKTRVHRKDTRNGSCKGDWGMTAADNIICDNCGEPITPGAPCPRCGSTSGRANLQASSVASARGGAIPSGRATVVGTTCRAAGRTDRGSGSACWPYGFSAHCTNHWPITKTDLCAFFCTKPVPSRVEYSLHQSSVPVTGIVRDEHRTCRRSSNTSVRPRYRRPPAMVGIQTIRI